MSFEKNKTLPSETYVFYSPERFISLSPIVVLRSSGRIFTSNKRQADSKTESRSSQLLRR
jgi:hypothetical protein